MKSRNGAIPKLPPVEFGEMRQDAMTTFRSMLQSSPEKSSSQLRRVASESTRLAGTIVQYGVLTALALFLLVGCGYRTVVNANLLSPYPAEKTWAVAPLINASGTTAADGLHLSDLLAQELQQVHRINVLPVNAVLDAMSALNLKEIQSVHDAQSIVRLLNVDGLVVGSITAYDPYSPPVLGMNLQLYTNATEFNSRISGGSINSSKGVRTLGATPSDSNLPGLRTFSQPVASAAAIVNAADNAVRIDLQNFAEGRTDPDTALGWRKFLYSMDAYSQYVGHRLIRDLLRAERRRLGGSSSAVTISSSNKRRGEVSHRTS